MRVRLLTACWVTATLVLCGVAAAQENVETPAETVSDFEAVPPPEDACAQETVLHILAERIGAWQREEDLVVGDVALTEPLLARLDPEAREMLDTYDALCGAAVTYHNTEGPGIADVVMIAFSSDLNALGFFAAQRTDSARRVLLTSAAYRDRGVLHVYSHALYFRVEVQQPHEEALPSDQYIASRLETRLPERVEPPRIIRLMPRGWVDPLTVSYEPTDLLGEELTPMAAGATNEVGAATMRLQIIEAEDHAQARHWYTIMLARALDQRRAWEVTGLGEEGFLSRAGDPAVGMQQDQFLVHVSTDGSPEEAVAIMRLVGTAIRTSRELPDEPEGDCPPFNGEPSP